MTSLSGIRRVLNRSVQRERDWERELARVERQKQPDPAYKQRCVDAFERARDARRIAQERYVAAKVAGGGASGVYLPPRSDAGVKDESECGTSIVTQRMASEHGR